MKALKDQQKFYITKLELPFDNWDYLKEAGINRTVYFAYQKSKEIGKELIDFDDTIWPDDVEAIVATLREGGITEFTISCRFCDLIDRLADFEKCGCKMNGVTEVKTAWKNLDGSVQMAKALRMEIL